MDKTVDELIPLVAKVVGIDSSTLVFYVMIAIMVCKVLARLIPDDSKGLLGGVRLILRTLAADVSNRITSGVTQVDVARHTLGLDVSTPVAETIRQLASEPPALIPEVLEDIQPEQAKPVKKAFPKHRARDESGKFISQDEQGKTDEG